MEVDRAMVDGGVVERVGEEVNDMSMVLFSIFSFSGAVFSEIKMGSERCGNSDISFLDIFLE